MASILCYLRKQISKRIRLGLEEEGMAEIVYISIPKPEVKRAKRSRKKEDNDGNPQASE